jgi:3D (Asp-Asp-Asp) domain-containing protein
VDSFAGSDWKTRTVLRFNMLVIAWLSARLTVVLWARRLTDGLARLPLVLQRRLTPVRVTAGLGLIALVAAPSTLYVVEKARHHETRKAYMELTIESLAETGYLRSTLLGLLDEQTRLSNLVLQSGATLVAGGKVYVRVLATGYSSSVMETDTTPTITAANTLTRPGTLAVSRDLLREYTPGAPFAFGDRVHVHGVGEFRVEDAMNARWDNRIDIWFPSREDALWFGRREVVLSRTLGDRPGDELPVLSGDLSLGLAPDGL